MDEKWKFGQYEEFVVRAASDLGIPLVDSIEDVKTGWGLRRLSRFDFDKLESQSKTDVELRERWLNRLQNGYVREKSQIAIEIEEIFSDVPTGNQFDHPGQEAAA